MKWCGVWILSLLGSLFAAEETKVIPPPPQSVRAIGINHFGLETLESLATTGLVKLNRTTVAHNLSVNGSLIAQGASIGSIDVIGEANLRDTEIQEGGTILGSFQMHHSKVHKPLTLNCKKAIFSSSTLADITVLSMDAFRGKQILELRQKTLVDGTIRFESGRGEVHLYPGSQVLGHISGGKIVKKH